jgi:hypothetical protein
MQNWSYTVLTTGPFDHATRKFRYHLDGSLMQVDGLSEALNDLGTDGWELIATVAGDDETTYIFKRLVE